MAEAIKAIRTTMVPKDVRVFDLTNITDDEMSVISNALFCFAGGIRPTRHVMKMDSGGKTEADVAVDLYTLICDVSQSNPKESV